MRGWGRERETKTDENEGRKIQTLYFQAARDHLPNAACESLPYLAPNISPHTSTMATTDALLALRHAIKSKATVKYSNASGATDSLLSATEIVLSPSVSLPKATPTRLRKPGTKSADPAVNPQDFFTLHAVYLAWLLKDASGAEYMKQARENGLAVGFVSVTERKSVVDWLEGRTSDLRNVAPAACTCLTYK